MRTREVDTEVPSGEYSKSEKAICDFAYDRGLGVKNDTLSIIGVQFDLDSIKGFAQFQSEDAKILVDGLEDGLAANKNIPKIMRQGILQNAKVIRQ